MWSRPERDEQTARTNGKTDELPATARVPTKLGKTVVIKGELTGSENLTISGRVEGRIDLPDHLLTIEPNAIIEADIVAKTVIAFGSVVGGVTARERLEVRRSGSIVGEIMCGCLAIHEGAYVAGRIEMAKPAGSA
jgi:cytoskeletal protein CcmA (bactofilin family)